MPPQRQKNPPKPKKPPKPRRVPYVRLSNDFRDIKNSLDYPDSPDDVYEVAHEMTELIRYVRDSVNENSDYETVDRAFMFFISSFVHLRTTTDEMFQEWAGNGETKVDIVKEFASAMVPVGVLLKRKALEQKSIPLYWSFQWHMRHYHKEFPGKGFDAVADAICLEEPEEKLKMKTEELPSSLEASMAFLDSVEGV
jgi:hypothetical protein